MRAFIGYDCINETYNIDSVNGQCILYFKSPDNCLTWLKNNAKRVADLDWELNDKVTLPNGEHLQNN